MHDLHQSLACWCRSAHFLTVVEKGSLHRAATRLRLSQPACRVRYKPIAARTKASIAPELDPG
jgi:hypothetical protein